MINIKFARRLKYLRKRNNISQEQFSLKINMSRSYYASVESGKRNISLDNICKIAKGFNISLSELFKGV